MWTTATQHTMTTKAPYHKEEENKKKKINEKMRK